MEAWQRIKARISQLFEPTLWELEIFALQEGIKRRDKALAQWEAKYWDEVKRGNQASAELEVMKAERDSLRSETRPVPPGVPSVDELAWIGSVAYANHKSESGIPEAHAAATAIRDAVIAGMRADNDKVNELLSDAWQQLEELGVVPRSLADTPALQPATVWTDDQIESLARVINKTWFCTGNEAVDEHNFQFTKERSMGQARAAVEFMRQTNQPVEVANAK